MNFKLDYATKGGEEAGSFGGTVNLSASAACNKCIVGKCLSFSFKNTVKLDVL